MSTSEYTDLPSPPSTPIPTIPPTEDGATATTNEQTKPQVKLTDVAIENEIVALNMLVQFLGLAQKRGAFTIDEAAKIWECVKKFQKPLDAAAA